MDFFSAVPDNMEKLEKEGGLWQSSTATEEARLDLGISHNLSF